MINADEKTLEDQVKDQIRILNHSRANNLRLYTYTSTTRAKVLLNFLKKNERQGCTSFYSHRIAKRITDLIKTHRPEALLSPNKFIRELAENIK